MKSWYARYRWARIFWWCIPVRAGEMSVELAIATIIESIKQAARRVPMKRLRILIENTAGMGSSVGSRLEEVAHILRGLKDLNVGRVFLDTAHFVCSRI